MILEPFDPASPADQAKVVEDIISCVARDFPTDTILRMAALHKEACGCARRTSESVCSLVKSFVGAAQAYLNLENAKRESTESHNFAMLLLSNSKVSSSTFTAIMNNLIHLTKDKAYRKNSSIPLDSDSVGKMLSTLQSFKDGKKQSQPLYISK